MRMSEDNLLQSVLSSRHVGPRYQTRVKSLAASSLTSPSHFLGLEVRVVRLQVDHGHVFETIWWLKITLSPCPVVPKSSVFSGSMSLGVAAVAF